jgi:D-alanyl-D-alanine dipeptidase
MTEIVLIADPKVTAIAVEDCGEPLLDVSAHEFMRIDTRKADPAGDWRQLRTSVIQRLARAAELLPANLYLLHIEGYRPPRLQALYFRSYYDRLAAMRPEVDPDELTQLASRHVSPPEIAPHSAGAAIDLTLCDANGLELDMGTRINATPEESRDACYTDAGNISAKARANRHILTAALSAAGLVNYATEWWHWSYGDRYWALQTGQPTAVYGTIDRTSITSESGSPQTPH